MPQRPTSREIVDEALAGLLDAYLAAEDAKQTSYASMARDLHERTGVWVDLTTIKRWCLELGLARRRPESQAS